MRITTLGLKTWKDFKALTCLSLGLPCTASTSCLLFTCDSSLTLNIMFNSKEAANQGLIHDVGKLLYFLAFISLQNVGIDTFAKFINFENSIGIWLL